MNRFFFDRHKSKAELLAFWLKEYQAGKPVSQDMLPLVRAEVERQEAEARFAETESLRERHAAQFRHAARHEKLKLMSPPKGVQHEQHLHFKFYRRLDGLQDPVIGVQERRIDFADGSGYMLLDSVGVDLSRMQLSLSHPDHNWEIKINPTVSSLAQAAASLGQNFPDPSYPTLPEIRPSGDAILNPGQGRTTGYPRG